MVVGGLCRGDEVVVGGQDRILLEGELAEGEEQGVENGVGNGKEAARAMPVAEGAVEGAV